MDPIIWKNSQRGFPFNISLRTIVILSLVTPVVLALSLIKFTEYHIYKLYIPTILISVFAYFLTDKLIDQFKGDLERTVKRGKDLNKAGNKEDKPSV
jgi:hypothetical protein